MGRGASTATGTPSLCTRGRPTEITYLGVVSCSLTQLADAWRVPYIETMQEFRGHAGRSSSMLEAALARRLGAARSADGSPYDLETAAGHRYEVRGFSRSLSFAPSSSLGSGRAVGEDDLARKIAAVDGFLICDVTKFPDIPCWLIPAEMVGNWLETGELGKSGRASRRRLFELLECNTTDRHQARAKRTPPRESHRHPSTEPEWRIDLVLAVREEEVDSADVKLLSARVNADAGRLLQVIGAAGSRVDCGEIDSLLNDDRAIAAAHALLQALVQTCEAQIPGEAMPGDPLQFIDVHLGKELVLRICLFDDAVALIRSYQRATTASSADIIACAFAEALLGGMVFSASSLAQRLGWRQVD